MDLETLIKRHQYAREMERHLHCLLPISFSTMVSFSFLSYLCSNDEWNWNWNNVSDASLNTSLNAWVLLPILFTICASWSVKFMCNLQSSYSYYSTFFQNSKNDNNIHHNSRFHNRNNNYNNNSNNNNNSNEDDLENEYRYKEQQKLEQQRKQREQVYYLQYHHTIPSSNGIMLSKMILYTPLLIYMLSYPTQRNQSLVTSSMMGAVVLQQPSASITWSAAILDLILVIFVPYMIHSYYLEGGLWWKNQLQYNMFTSTATENDAKGGNSNNGRRNTKQSTIKIASRTVTIHSMLIILCTVLLIEIVINRYLIQLCLYISHFVHHDGQNIHSKGTISFLLHCGISLLGLQECWKRYQRNNNNNTNNLNRYHKSNNLMEGMLDNGDGEGRDISIDEPFIVVALASGFCFGYALALPWHFLLYIFTFCLGFGLYIPTRQVSL